MAALFQTHDNEPNYDKFDNEEESARSSTTVRSKNYRHLVPSGELLVRNPTTVSKLARGASGQRFAVLSTLLVAVVLAVMFACFASAPPQQTTLSEVYASEQSISSVASDAQIPAVTSTGNVSGEVAQSTQGESIDDEGNPLSSGLGASEPVSSGGVSIGVIAVVGILAVGAFFSVLIRKLNANISDMNGMFK